MKTSAANYIPFQAIHKVTLQEITYEVFSGSLLPFIAFYCNRMLIAYYVILFIQHRFSFLFLSITVEHNCLAHTTKVEFTFLLVYQNFFENFILHNIILFQIFSYILSYDTFLTRINIIVINSCRKTSNIK